MGLKKVSILFYYDFFCKEILKKRSHVDGFQIVLDYNSSRDKSGVFEVSSAFDNISLLFNTFTVIRTDLMWKREHVLKYSVRELFE